MTSPNPPHSVKLEIFVNGAWTDVSGDFLSERAPAAITRGFSGETASQVDPGRLTLTLDNRSRNYSPRNPNSAYYGTFKRGMPARLSVTSAGTNYRFQGETAGITPSADQSGISLTTDLEVGGPLRRLTQGAQTVRSLPRSYIPTTSPLAYWPLEDGPTSGQGVPVAGPNSMVHLGTLPQGWAAGSLAPWLPPALQGKIRDPLTDNARFAATIPAQGFSTGWAIDYVVNGRTDYKVTASHSTVVGSVDAWTLSMSPSIDSINVTAPSGSTGGGSITFIHDGLFHHVRFQVVENFIGDATYTVYVDGVVVTSGHVTAAGPEPVIDVLQISVDLNDHQPLSKDTTRVTIGHVAFYENVTPPAIATMVQAAYGNPGELAGSRLVRICADQTIPLTMIGTSGNTRPCGPQYTIGVVDLLQETADVDGGLLCETLTAIGLTYITRGALYNKTVDLPLTYTTNHHLGSPLAPVDDDQTLRNDVTVTQKSGSAQQVTQTSGPLSTAAPPAGVGKYATSLTINCFSQAQALDQAGWIALNTGTWDEARYPSIKFNMNVLPLTQRAQVMALNVGARLTITSPPSWLPPDQIDLLILGIKETLTRFKWDIELVCQPYGPYRVGVWDDTTLGRYSSDGSTVTATSGATSWSVATPSGPLWTTAAGDFPLDINCEGERVTVTNITGAASPQTFTVTRSVNGIVKAHTAASVNPWQQMRWAM